MRETLGAFTAAYVDYLKNPTQETRSQVLRLIPEADEALMAGGGGFAFTDAPAMGPFRQRYATLSATAFLHEQHGWERGVHGRPTHDLVIEGLERADSVLTVAQSRAVERRRRPTYWLDRAVRAVLMLPAYILSVIVGESVGKIDRSAWGLPLRVLAIVADALGVYAGGKLLKLW
jgi:hypothetical protein